MFWINGSLTIDNSFDKTEVETANCKGIEGDVVSSILPLKKMCSGAGFEAHRYVNASEDLQAFCSNEGRKSSRFNQFIQIKKGVSRTVKVSCYHSINEKFLHDLPDGIPNLVIGEGDLQDYIDIRLLLRKKELFH